MPLAITLLAVGLVLLVAAVGTVALQSNAPLDDENRALLITGGALSAAVAGAIITIVGAIALILS